MKLTSLDIEAIERGPEELKRHRKHCEMADRIQRADELSRAILKFLLNEKAPAKIAKGALHAVLAHYDALPWDTE